MPCASLFRVRRWIESENPLARILRNMLWLASSKGVGAVLSIIYLGIATRTLGVENFGRFALVLGVGVLISTFVQFDCWRAILRFGPHYRRDGDSVSLGRLIAACRLFDFTTAIIGCGLAWLVLKTFHEKMSLSDDMASTGTVYCCVLLLATRSTPMGLLRLYDRFDLSAYADSMVPVTRMIGSLVTLFINADVQTFLIIWGCSEVASAITFWLLASRVDPDSMRLRHSKGVRALYRQEPELLRFLAILNIAGTLTHSVKQLPVLLIGNFVGPIAAGLFRLANQLTKALSKTSLLAARSVYAELNHVHAHGGIEALRRLLTQTNRIALFSGAFLVMIIALLGKHILLLIAGEAFVAAYPLLLLLGIAEAIDFMGINYEPALLASSSGKTVLRLQIAVAALLLILLAILLPRMGEVGAAYAMLGASIGKWILFKIATIRHIHAAGKA